MCSRTSGTPHDKPAWAGWLLMVCLLALSLHFVGESLLLAATPDQRLVAAPGQSPHPGHDATEDHFVLASPAVLSVEPSSTHDHPARPVEVYLLLLAPPVPPPNL
jgi:uncharacterized iron-regulated membrane protein